MSKYRNYIYVFSYVIIFLLLGCSPKDYKNVSHENQYKSALGAEFKTNADLLGIGVTFDSSYKQNVDYVFITPKPGFTGPEVLFRKRVPKGIKFTVVGILISDRLFNNRLFYEIKFMDDNLFEEYTVIVKVFDDINNQNKGLNVDDFEYLRNNNIP
jgi:hypothetical protein